MTNEQRREVIRENEEYIRELRDKIEYFTLALGADSFEVRRCLEEIQESQETIRVMYQFGGVI